MSPKISWTLFGGHPKYNLMKNFGTKVAQTFFWQVWGNLSKNPSNPKNLPAPPV